MASEENKDIKNEIKLIDKEIERLTKEQERLKAQTYEGNGIFKKFKDNEYENVTMFNDLIDKVNVSGEGFTTSGFTEPVLDDDGELQYDDNGNILGSNVEATNDQLITPYTSGEGLKFLTINHLKAFRQTIEPAIGYYIGQHPSNPDYNIMRPTYDNRTEATATRYWTKKRCGVEPQIIAGNSVIEGVKTPLVDAYIEFWSGDPEGGNYRIYYPAGVTWWHMNNVIGLRVTNCCGTTTHMDTPQYGDQTRSMICYFLHGFLPLNKKILAAYAILEPSSVLPAKEPLGKDWIGRVYYKHYHAFTRPETEFNIEGKWHETLPDHLHLTAGYKYRAYDNVGDMMDNSAEGEKNRNYYIKKWEDPTWREKQGTDEIPNKSQYWLPGEFQSSKQIPENRIIHDEFGIPHYIKKRPEPKEKFTIIDDSQIGEFKDDGRHIEWLFEPKKNLFPILIKNEYQSYYDFGENEMKEATSDINHYFDEDWWGELDANGLPVWKYIKLEGQEFEKLEENRWTRWGKDIVSYDNKITENEIWKQLNTQEFDDYIETNRMDLNFCCSDGEYEDSYDFTAMNPAILDGFFQEQLQDIPGYFNYNGMNSAKTQNLNISFKKPKIEIKWKNEQILYQSESDTKDEVATISKKLQDKYQECGAVPIVLNITQTVKNAYEKRVSREFVCHAGGTVDEVKDNLNNAEKFRWEGSGEEANDFDEFERENWNSYWTHGRDKWIILNDDYHYPEVDNNGKIVINSMDRINQPMIFYSNTIQSTKDFSKGVSFKPSCFFYILYQKSGEAETEIECYFNKDNKDLEIYSFEDFCEKLEKAISEKEIKCKVNVLEGQRCFIEIEMQNAKKISFDDFNIFSQVFEVDIKFSDPVSNRIVSCSSSLESYHPTNLQSPIRGETLNVGEWRTRRFTDENQYFIMDLCQTPLGDYRRDWRYRQGTNNYSNCICPNENCETRYYNRKVPGQQKNPEALQMTVGEWATKRNITMSEGQSTCPACNTDLSEAKGVVAIDSDGIKTYYYQDSFDENPLIKTITISPANEDIYKCGCKVFLQNSETGIWIPVFRVSYDKNTDSFSVSCSMNKEKGSVSFDGETAEFNFTKYFRARYIKVETIANHYNYHRKCHKGSVLKISENTIIIKTHTDIEEDALVNKGIKFKVGEWDYENTEEFDCRIINNYVSYDDEFKCKVLIIKLDKTMDYIFDYVLGEVVKAEDLEFSFYTDEYFSGIRDFVVAGLPFQKRKSATSMSNLQLTILPPGDFETGLISNEGFTLSQQPLQILNVYVGSVNGELIQLTEDKNLVNEYYGKGLKDFYYKTKKCKLVDQDKTITYYEVDSGNYFYDPIKNRIIVPTHARIEKEIKENGKTSIIEQIVSLSELRIELVKNGIYSKGQIVNQVIVEYWSASNSGVTIEAEAAESGPSYQLEPESICVIRKDSLDKLEKCGESVPLYTNDSSTKDSLLSCYKSHPINWFCYNHVPATLKDSFQTANGGYFRKQTFYGRELDWINPDVSANNSKRVKDLFGKHCTGIMGTCFSEVTFYGPPNSILSGDIVAVAPTKKTITYKCPGCDNEDKLIDNTGGLDDGMIVLEIRPSQRLYGNENKNPERKTMGWQSPSVVVYVEDDDIQ